MASNKQLAVYTSIKPIVANGFFSPLIWEDALQYSTYAITLTADKNCTITVQFTNDRFNITYQQVFTVLAGEAFNYNDVISSSYFRLRVDNIEGTNMTTFSLSTYLKNDGKSSNVVSAILWDNDQTGLYGTSATINSNFNINNYTFFGDVDGATDLIVQISNDGSTWYSTQYTYTSSGASQFGFNVSNLVAQYVRLQSTNDVSAEAYCNANS
jgi:hypothetical protein